jgi:hypothetical protein
MRETNVKMGNPGSNRPSIFDDDGSHMKESFYE